jgi:tetratricopeptide (TPR) repeat protein
MNPTRQPVKIFLASSGDLMDERDFCEVLFNRIGKAHPHLHLEPIRWDTDLPSGSVSTPRIQDAINPLLDASDVVVVLCYSRLGIFTLEEYRRTLAAGKKLFVYFKTGFSPKNSAEHAAYGSILALREEIEAGNKILFKEFANNDKLENLLRHDFALFLLQNYPAPQTNATKKPNRFLTIIPRPAFVRGREALLAEIHKTLEPDGAAVLIRGIGGIGKTTAALAYLHHPEYGGRYNHVVWLEIASTLPEAFARQSGLHEMLSIRPQMEELLAQNDLDGIVRTTLNALRDLPGQTLLALDNANDRDEIRRWKRALTDSGCRLLLTSRADIPNVAEIPIGELEPADAAVLFWHHYCPNAPVPAEGDEADAVVHLLSEVQYHTLLIEMLGKIGKQAGLSVADLRKRVADGYVFSNDLQRIVPTGNLVERKAGGMDESTLENLVLFLFQGLAPGLSDAERDLLRQLALLPPIAHDPNLLARLFGVANEEQTNFFNAIDAIDKRGVPVKKGDTYQLHRLVRAVTLRELTPTSENCAAVLRGVTDLLGIDQTKDNPIHKFPFVSYGETLLETFGETDKPSISELQNNLATVYQEMGNYERAQVLGEAALASNLKYFGPNHPNVAASQSNLADVYRKLGNYEKAEDLLESALGSGLMNFGPDHPTVSMLHTKLFTLYSDLGQYEKARVLLEAALIIDKLTFGTDHPFVANKQTNLALVYKKLGNYEKARELGEAALASNLKYFGPNHPNVAATQSNLAVVYQEMGNYERARELGEAALASDLKSFGPDHPNVADRQFNLALVYREMGNYKKARDLLEAALGVGLMNFGSDHLNVAATQLNLTTVYFGLGNYKRARELGEAALASYLKNFGPDNPTAYTPYEILAFIEIATKNWSAAKEKLQQALSIGIRVWGEGHPDVQDIRRYLAYVETQLKKTKRFLMPGWWSRFFRLRRSGREE